MPRGALSVTSIRFTPPLRPCWIWAAPVLSVITFLFISSPSSIFHPPSSILHPLSSIYFYLIFFSIHSFIPFGHLLYSNYIFQLNIPIQYSNYTFQLRVTIRYHCLNISIDDIFLFNRFDSIDEIVHCVPYKLHLSISFHFISNCCLFALFNVNQLRSTFVDILKLMKSPSQMILIESMQSIRCSSLFIQQSSYFRFIRNAFKFA